MSQAHAVTDKTTGIGISKQGEITGLERLLSGDYLQSLQSVIDMWRGGLKPEKRRKNTAKH